MTCIESSIFPLQIFRLLNLVLTTSTLGVAVKERQVELDNHILGAMGSSVYVTCISLHPHCLGIF